MDSSPVSGKLAEGLPPGWTAHQMGKTGTTFYYNASTSVSQYERPGSIPDKETKDGPPLSASNDASSKTRNEPPITPANQSAATKLSQQLVLSQEKIVPNASDYSSVELILKSRRLIMRESLNMEKEYAESFGQAHLNKMVDVVGYGTGLLGESADTIKDERERLREVQRRLGAPLSGAEQMFSVFLLKSATISPEEVFDFIECGGTDVILNLLSSFKEIPYQLQIITPLVVARLWHLNFEAFPKETVLRLVEQLTKCLKTLSLSDETSEKALPDNQVVAAVLLALGSITAVCDVWNALVEMDKDATRKLISKIVGILNMTVLHGKEEEGEVVQLSTWIMGNLGLYNSYLHSATDIGGEFVTALLYRFGDYILKPEFVDRLGRTENIITIRNLMRVSCATIMTLMATHDISERRSKRSFVMAMAQQLVNIMRRFQHDRITLLSTVRCLAALNCHMKDSRLLAKIIFRAHGQQALTEAVGLLGTEVPRPLLALSEAIGSAGAGRARQWHCHSAKFLFFCRPVTEQRPASMVPDLAADGMKVIDAHQKYTDMMRVNVDLAFALKAKGVEFSDMSTVDVDLDATHCSQKLEQFFNIPDDPSTLLILSFCGPASVTGSWQLAQDSYVSYSIVKRLWQASLARTDRSALLLLLLDHSYSGIWLEEARSSAYSSDGIVIQTSCGPGERARAGEFLKWWTEVQTSGESRIAPCLKELKEMHQEPSMAVPWLNTREGGNIIALSPDADSDYNAALVLMPIVYTHSDNIDPENLRVGHVVEAWVREDRTWQLGKILSHGKRKDLVRVKFDGSGKQALLPLSMIRVKWSSTVDGLPLPKEQDGLAGRSGTQDETLRQVLATEEFLKHVEPFDVLLHDKIFALSKSAVFQKFPANCKVIKEGQVTSDSMYVVYSGSLSVRKGPKQLEVGLLKVGDYFGERPNTSDRSPQHATIITREETHLYALQYSAMEPFLAWLRPHFLRTEAARMLEAQRVMESESSSPYTPGRG